MADQRRVALLGATGFIGCEVRRALSMRGAEVVPVRAPRLDARSDAATVTVESDDPVLATLRDLLRGCDVIVNAAGVSEATESDLGRLMAANGALPGLVARAAAGRRFIHISSAAVLGAAKLIDDSPAQDGFSPYSRSKAVGERSALTQGGQVVIFRPAGVHGSGRRVTHALGRIAQSRLASVAAPGTQPAPHALVENVADAVAFLALTDQRPPSVVTHPHEGLSVTTLLRLLGGHPPRHIPAPVARALVDLVRVGACISSTFAATARRLEVLWFGQQQAPSWLTGAGWTPLQSHDGWRALGAQLTYNRSNRLEGSPS